jgi:hypothetical protein
VGYDLVGPTADEQRANKLPIGVAAPSTAPTTRVAGKSVHPPQVYVRVYDQSANQLLPTNTINDAKPVDLADPEGITPIPVYITPQGTQQLVQSGQTRIFIALSGPTKGFQYSAGPEAVELRVPGERPDSPQRVIQPAYNTVKPTASEVVAHPYFRGRYGLGGEQLAGKAKDGPSVIMSFQKAPQTTSNEVPFIMRVGIERSGDESEDQLTQVEATAFNPKTGELSPPTRFYIEANRQAFFHLPRNVMENGHFDVRLRSLTDGHYLILRPDSISMVQAQQSFDLNLLKSLLILWLMSILVTIIAIFCSTFLSWPIAIVLTLVILLGKWGVDQLGDSTGSGIGNQVATDLGFKNAAEAKVVSTSVEALSRFLNTVSSVLPDIGAFGGTESVERGVSIPPREVYAALVVLLAFGVPLTMAAYLVLRNKEVAP